MNKRMIVIIGEDEGQKQEYLAKLEGYEIYYNPENNKHPKVQKEFIENIVQDANIFEKNISIATNSPYVLTVLNNLFYAGKLKNKISADKFVEIMGNKYNYILPYELDVINLDTNKSIVDDEIVTEEIDTISDTINEQYTALYYEEEELMEKYNV